MHIIGTLFIGLIVGWVARFLLPGKQDIGLIMTSLLGVAGSFIATYAGQFLGLYPAGAAAGFIASVVGAFVLLFVATKVLK
ncbi:MAG: GlsB/YeaQ/YmgE family stress response membrane protein [Proteobacteria bacterium]|nr:GlsB/YeaQ/YmgE family stress response membrane protein [Pseudomonadota bacterium]